MKKKGLNCSDFIPSVCQAYCCGPVPVSKAVYAKNLHKRCRPVIQEQDYGDMILPDTGEKKCTFLSDAFTCQIYHDRPQVCRDFGKTDSPLMQCPFMDKYGIKRSPEDRKRIEKEFQDALNPILGELGGLPFLE